MGPIFTSFRAIVVQKRGCFRVISNPPKLECLIPLHAWIVGVKNAERTPPSAPKKATRRYPFAPGVERFPLLYSAEKHAIEEVELFVVTSRPRRGRWTGPP